MERNSRTQMPKALRSAAVDSVTDAITRGRKRRSGRRNVAAGEIQVGTTTSISAEEVAERGRAQQASYHKRRRTSLIPGHEGDVEDDSNDEWEEHVEMDKDVMEAAVESMKVEASGKEEIEASEKGTGKVLPEQAEKQDAEDDATAKETEIKLKERARANAARKKKLRRHTVHIMFCVAHLLRLDAAADYEETQGFALSVTPSDVSLSTDSFEEGLSRLGLWLRASFRTTATPQVLSKVGKITGENRICSASERAIACAREGGGDVMDMVTFVAAVVRNQGFRCRIVSCVQPLSHQPPKKAKTTNRSTGKPKMVELSPDHDFDTVLYAWLEIWSPDSRLWTPFDVCEGYASGEQASEVIRNSMARIQIAASQESERKNQEGPRNRRSRRSVRKRAKDAEEIPSRKLPATLFSHVVAVENGLLTDVTRRYTRSWVDVEKARAKGKAFEKVLAALSAGVDGEGMDEAQRSEAAEFGVLASGEAVPTSVTAVQRHPTYVLERHLKRYEVIHPKEPIVGYIKDEPIFLRSNVQLLHTKDRWIRRMRVVKEDAESLKSVRSKNGTDDTVDLYGEWQTDPLEIPACVDGKVPRSFRGNVDLWTPDHLPKGTVHVNMPYARIAARKLNIDFAPAMTGFDVRGGRSIPRIEGVVVATENATLVTNAAQAAAFAAAERQERRAREDACERWLKLLRTVKAREKVKKRYGGMLEAGGTYEAAQKREGLRRAQEEKYGKVDAEPSRGAKIANSKAVDAIAADNEGHEHEYGDARAIDEDTWVKSCKICKLDVAFETL